MDVVITKIVKDGALPKGSESSKISGESSFKKVLDQTLQGGSNERSAMAQKLLGNGPEEANRVKAVPAEQLQINPNLLEAGKKTDFMHILGKVNRSGLQIDEMIEMVTNRQSMNPQELLAAQAAVSYAVMEVDFTGQIAGSADRARNSLLNIQV